MQIVFGMAALGALVGLFVAWSASPIVQTLLPLLFGMIGGASGVSILKIDSTEAKGKAKIAMIGNLLGSFSIACLLVTLIGIGLKPIVRGWIDGSAKELTLTNQTASGLVDQMLLRRRLHALGASESEIVSFFDLSKVEPPDQAVATAALQNIRTHAQSFVQAYVGVPPPSKALTFGWTGAVSPLPPDITLADLYLRCGIALKQLEVREQAGPIVDPKEITLLLDPIASFNFSKWLAGRDDDGKSALAAYPALMQSYTFLVGAIDSSYLGDIKRLNERHISQVDDLLRTLGGVQLERQTGSTIGSGSGDNLIAQDRTPVPPEFRLQLPYRDRGT